MNVFIIVKLLWVIAALTSLMACAPAVRNPAPLAGAEVSPRSAPAKEYRIQQGDQLDVKFFYNPELNEQVIVRPDGRISLQLATEIIAAGVTPAELTEQLRKRYATAIKNPEIAVIVRSFVAQRVYVDGEVVKPGVVTLVEPMTVMQAISQAGGFKDTARKDEVIVVRRTSESTAAPMTVNLAMALDGTDMRQDIPLISYDVVYVPKSAIADVNVWIDQYIRRNIPVPFSIGVTPFD